MSWMRKIWNYEQPETSRKQLKYRALRGFVWLLLFMLTCTLLSRAADSLTMAVVKAERPRQASITETITFSGVLKADGDIPVTGYAGVMVQSVAVAQGDRVTAGDLLLRLDLEPLKEQIAEKEQNIVRKQAELKAAKSTDRQSSREKDTDGVRAQEDLDQAILDADRAIAQAREDVETAEKTSLDYGRYTSAEQFSKIQANALENDIRLRQRDVEQAEADKAAIINNYQRQLEDAAVSAPRSSTPALLQLDIDQLQLDIEKLQAAVDSKGEVYAPMDGIVTAVSVSVGQLTGSDALFLLNDGMNIQFVGEITEKQMDDVEVDASLTLRVPGQEKPLYLTVSSVEVSMDRPDRYLVYAPVAQGQGVPGQSAEADVDKRSGMRPSCISLSALRMEGGQPYVLQVVEQISVLGTEYVIKRVDVQVETRNESAASILGAVDDQSDLVVTSTKPLKDGDRVRMGD